MKVLIDNPLPPSLVDRLRQAGHDAIHVATMGMHAALDEEILAVAAAEHRVVVTSDADFGALLALGGASGPSVVFLRSVTPRTSARLAPLVLRALDAAEEPLLRGAIVVLDDTRVRVRRLPIGGAHDDDEEPPRPGDGD